MEQYLCILGNGGRVKVVIGIRIYFWEGSKDMSEATMIDDFGDPHPTTHRYFLTLTAAVAGIIGSGTDIANLDSQPHWPDLFRCNIIVTSPTTPSDAHLTRTHAHLKSQTGRQGHQRVQEGKEITDDPSGGVG